MRNDIWPALPLDAWRDTYATLHMWTQIVGKICVALTPLTNHFWNSTFQVTSRGLMRVPANFLCCSRVSSSCTAGDDIRLTFAYGMPSIDRRLKAIKRRRRQQKARQVISGYLIAKQPDSFMNLALNRPVLRWPVCVLVHPRST